MSFLGVIHPIEFSGGPRPKLAEKLGELCLQAANMAEKALCPHHGWNKSWMCSEESKYFNTMNLVFGG